MLTLVDDGQVSGPVVFSIDVPLRWSDQDADGHVNNATILRLTEEARMRWCAVLRLNDVAPDLMSVLANLACVFKAPIHYPGVVRVDVSCARLGNSSVGLLFDLRDATATDTLYAQASVTWVWVNKETMRAHPMPPVLRDVCSGASETGVSPGDASTQR